LEEVLEIGSLEDFVVNGLGAIDGESEVNGLFVGVSFFQDMDFSHCKNF
jgi:hypothetical protein